MMLVDYLYCCIIIRRMKNKEQKYTKDTIVPYSDEYEELKIKNEM